MKTLTYIAIALAALLALAGKSSQSAPTPQGGNVVVAYVTSWTECMPDPALMTHINYAFAHVSPTFDSVKIDNPERLRRIVALKAQNPDLKVVLSIGGWGSGRFSEMAADPKLHAAFAADCAAKMRLYGLDGIDIDWEYPTSDAAGISCSPADTENYTSLMRDLRAAIGEDALLTLAAVWRARFIDFRAIDPYIDFVNVMAYDMTPASAGRPHAPLFASEAAGSNTTQAALQAFLEAGVPPCKIVMGIPFYGRGTGVYPDYVDYKDLKVLPGTREVWDSVAQTPYMVDSISGKILMGFENERSNALKLHYIKTQGLRGAMYYEYCADNGTLRTQVADSLLRR